jgi:putative ABC transport system substrate-binding protein
MFRPTMDEAAPRMGVTLAWSPVHSAMEIERVAETVAATQDGALLVIPDSFTFAQRELLIAVAARHRLPAIYPIRFFAIDGGLLAYGIDRVDLFRRAADYVHRIIKGTPPGELPVQQPTKFELAINLKTAKTLGLTIPQSLLLSADDVIE